MVRKGVNAAITISGIICLNYALLRLMPGDPDLSLTPRGRKYQGLAEYNGKPLGFGNAPWARGSIVGHYFTWWPALPSQGYYDDMLGPWAWDGAHLASAAQHLILPALTLTLGTLAGISLVMRSSLIDVMTEDFVTTAKAKGLSD